MTPRDYQMPSIQYLANIRRGILQAPAGSGKTFMAGAALADCLSRREGVATVKVLCNTIEQKGQWQDAFGHFPIIAKKAAVEISCHAASLDTWDADLLIVDECHRSASASWSAAINQAPKARWGVSATPWADPERDAILRKLFGSNFYEVKRDALVEDGHLAPARVLYLDADCEGIRAKIDALAADLIEKRKRKMPFLFKHEASERKQINQCKWQAAQQIGLWENEARDWLIVSNANRKICDGHHVIILVGKIEHGERLLPAIPGAVLCYSGMGKKRRREAIEGFKASDIRALIATSMLDEGSDFPIADCLIIASAGRSFRKSVQSTGRVLRPYKNKDCGLIIDFKDNFHPMLKRQSQARLKVYRSLGYKMIDE
jgi:superfamily II DNA or RNA helicase